MNSRLTAASVLICSIYLLLVPLAGSAAGRISRSAEHRIEAQRLRSYAISQCIALEFPDTPVAEDAQRAFGGYAELGSSSFDMYVAIVNLVQRYMASPYQGKGGKSLHIMQCLDLQKNPELSALIRSKR